jgi:signal transduction histidine kinase/ligand-binding sensor domain-containing protein
VPRILASLALALLGAFLPVRPGRAQDGRLTDPPAFRLDQWTTDEGLPQNSVNALAQAPEGFLWIGTFGGLARFDGTTFRLIERSDSLGRHIDRILSLAIAPDSALWIGTEEDGLLRYHHGVFELFTRADGLPDNSVLALHVDRTGALWIGTERGGIARRVAGRFERLAAAGGVAIDAVVSFVEAPDGTLRANAGDRVIRMVPGDSLAGTWEDDGRFRPSQLLLVDRAGAPWYRFPEGIAPELAARAGRRVPVASTSALVEDPGGGYWVGTYNDGLLFFHSADSTGLRQYPLPNGRQEYRVRAALVDRENNVWFGTNANGLVRVKRNVFATYTMAHGLTNDVATAVLADRAGKIWSASNCWGVSVLDLDRHAIRVHKPRKPGDRTGDPCVFALTEAAPGTMWLGTYGGGLTRIREGREEWLGHQAIGLRDSVVLSLFTDRSGTVWVGTQSGGLAALSPGGRVARTYTTADGLAHDNVRAIYQTRDGALWIGTLEGLSRLQEGRFRNFTSADGLAASHVRAIYEDGEGHLWVGTYGGGLHLLRGGRFVRIGRDHGLADDVVSAILEDERGSFWMSGNRGIFRADRRELLDFAAGRVARVHSVLYGEADGLGDAETNGGFQPAGWKDGRGRLWFPTVGGLAVVVPARVRVQERAPPVSLEEVVVNGVVRPLEDGLTVGPGPANVEFRYTGLSLSNPDRLVFRYRLENYESDWVEAGTRRAAYYPRLPPGRYRFVVLAANRDGVWNETGSSVEVRVRAPFYLSWWFRVPVLFGLAFLAVLLWHRRERAVQRARLAQEDFARRLIESQEHERKRLAGELHDGLGQELLVVRNRALLALKHDGLSPPARQQLTQISEVVAQSLEGVRRLAHHLTPLQLDHLGISTSLRSMLQSVAETSGIALTATIEDIDDLLPVEHQISLYRVVQEGLNNIVRHAGATEATVWVRTHDDSLRVTIQDNGCGFRVRRDGRGQVTGGFGLAGMAERIRILGGALDFLSEPGAGTRVTVSIPLRRVSAAPAR